MLGLAQRWLRRCTELDSVATIPTAAYTFGCMLTGTVLAMLWRTRAEPLDPVSRDDR